MLVRPANLEIPDDDPFRFDALERSAIEPPLTEFVSQASAPFVLAIDGGWGTGKTTFIKMWQAMLQRRGHLCLYFNAWETDFAEDPLVPLIGEISSVASAQATGKKGEKLRRQLDRTKTVAASILKRSIPVAAKLATAGVLDLNSLLEGGLSDLASDIAKDQIEAYENAKSELERFKFELGKLVERTAKTASTSSANVILFVDELDRCRPSYAVELLERVKHLFDVERLVFVLGIDRKQLTHSIRALHGSEFDATGYLRRFIDFDYLLPEPPNGNYCDYLFKLFNVDGFILSRATRTPRQELKNLRDVLSALFSAAQFTLREQLQAVSRLRIVLQTVPRDHPIFEFGLAILLFIREWRVEFFSGLLDGTVDPVQVIESLESLPAVGDLFDKHTGRLVEAIILSGAEELGFESSRTQHYRTLLESDDPDAEKDRAEQVIKLVNHLREGTFTRGERAGFEFTKKRIALIDNLVAAEVPAANQKVERT